MTKSGEPCQGGLFLPGWGATAGLYDAGLPPGWAALDLPSFRQTHGRFFVYYTWLSKELDRRERPVALAGHSMGAALALLAAIERPELAVRLVLLSPAGLPLTKTMRASMATFVRQVVNGRYPLGHLRRVVARVASAPVSSLRLARSVHGLDVRPELGRFRAARSWTVVGCSTDTLTPPAHCRELADLLGADYREVDASDGHIWPITHPQLLSAELSR
ncbi:MAG TPA: alpha/beta hydrolase [Gaiellaceae bacterium]|nr:alpha/beta hydrolase [Gaiellaceae bacterium]